MNEQESFEERRGKYILSANQGENDNVHICFRGNSYFDINNGRATFSITFSDDAKDVYFDMKYCEVRPIGDYDKLARRLKRANVLMFIMSSMLIFVSVSNAGLI